MPSRKKLYLILIGLCLLAYSNSLHNAFISDDLPAILENNHIQQFSQNLFYPQGLFNSLAYLISGFNPIPYHLISIILHCLNTILVFMFLGLFFKTMPSFLGACIFAVHPIHTEAVSWISGRPYIITSLFILISYLLYHRLTLELTNNRKLNLKLYLLCLSIFSYYLVANISFYFVFPLFLILADITFNRWQKTWRLWFPFLVIVALRLFLARNDILQRFSFTATEAGQQVSWSNPILNLAYSFFTHLWLLLWPTQLTLYHEPVGISPFALRLEVVFLFLLLAISLFFLFRRSKKLFFALGIFVLFLAPTYSPIWISSLVAERYLYFPSIALSMAIALGYERYAGGRLKKLFLGILISLILAYSIRTLIRNQDWKTPDIFWKKTVEISPRSEHAHSEFALSCFNKGDVKNAIIHYNKAIEINPRYAKAYCSRGIVYQSQGDYSQAFQDYNKTIEINPKLAETYNNRGLAYQDQGDYDQAFQDYSKAIKINPDFADAYYNRARAYQTKGELKLALQDYNKAIELKPAFAEAYNNRGLIYQTKGELKLALQDFNKAIAINPAFAELFNNRGLAYRKQGDFASSLGDYNKAIELNPNYAEAYNNRAVMYFEMREYNKSWEDAQKAESLGYKINPNFLDRLKKVSGREQ